MSTPAKAQLATAAKDLSEMIIHVVAREGYKLSTRRYREIVEKPSTSTLDEIHAMERQLARLILQVSPANRRYLMNETRPVRRNEPLTRAQVDVIQRLRAWWETAPAARKARAAHDRATRAEAVRQGAAEVEAAIKLLRARDYKVMTCDQWDSIMSPSAPRHG